ncbi:Detected protein of unknown function [Hibiscus syriacus]|uniref:Uncharacterized protein n=1 Tax=Hibiscus syriacus TaxID=106335 RepID=A0A6A2XZU7_HIBSY|nr:Detected protein of unknown function [Hibiscus syriacus]
MGRQGGGDPTVVSSSITLLQERFRQLLLKLLPESDMRFEPNGSTAAAARQQPRQDSSLSLGLSSHGRRTDFRAMEIPASSTSLWPNETSSTSNKFETCDVDTSLHL